MTKSKKVYVYMYICMCAAASPGAGPLWDDGSRLPEEGADDARPHPRMLCGLPDTGRVGPRVTFLSCNVKIIT